jgi:hypothetical protein
MIGPMAAMSCIICHRLLVAARRGQKKPHERLRAVEFGVDLRRGTEVLDVTGHTFFHCSADGAPSEVDGFPRKPKQSYPKRRTNPLRQATYLRECRRPASHPNLR